MPKFFVLGYLVMLTKYKCSANSIFSIGAWYIGASEMLAPDRGSFSDDVLTQAQKLLSTFQKEKDRIQNILNNATKAAYGQ